MNTLHKLKYKNRKNRSSPRQQEEKCVYIQICNMNNNTSNNKDND